MNRLTIILSLASLAAFSARAARAARAAEPVSGPTVEQALQAFKTQDSLKVELVASEPLTASPCAMAFDERGREAASGGKELVGDEHGVQVSKPARWIGRLRTGSSAAPSAAPSLARR